MNHPLRVAVVGSGEIAEQHGRALQANPRAKVSAVVDVSEANATRFAARWGGRSYPTLEACLETVDAVYILTPPSVRTGYTLAAIAAGKHVFCEKPLAGTEADARKILSAAAASPVVSMMGLNMRYRTGFGRLREAVKAGELGRPRHFWRQRFGTGPGASGKITDNNWRTDPAFAVGMTVESFSHDADLLRWILEDEVVWVSAIVYGTVPDLPAFDNNAYVLFRTAGGVSATITASWTSWISCNECGILGETGTAFLSGSAPGNNGIWCSREYHVRTDRDAYERVEMIHDDLDGTSYVRETEDFINAILDGTSPLTGIRDGYETMRISNAVLESARTGLPVDLG
ncbi:MAG: Gfo/Idh/MocA family protein [Opitutales bacterium]